LTGHSGFEVGSLRVRSRVTASERPNPLSVWVQTHCRRGSGQIHDVAKSVGLAGPFVAVGLRWLRRSFFGLGISHFDLVRVNSFSFFALDEVSYGDWML
jgi:hypothetical protein